MIKRLTTILCFGDSNTYGYNPGDGFRYGRDVRWPSVMQTLLGASYEIIEEGCNGRTGGIDNAEEPWNSGLSCILSTFYSHKPVDLLIIMLGSNDLKNVFHASAEDIVDGVGRIVKTLKAFCAEREMACPAILLVSPPAIGPDILRSPFASDFSLSAITRSKQFPGLFKQLAEKEGCLFFDAATAASVSELDSLHLTAEAHKALAGSLAKLIKQKTGF